MPHFLEVCKSKKGKLKLRNTFFTALLFCICLLFGVRGVQKSPVNVINFCKSSFHQVLVRRRRGQRQQLHGQGELHRGLCRSGRSRRLPTSHCSGSLWRLLPKIRLQFRDKELWAIRLWRLPWKQQQVKFNDVSVKHDFFRGLLTLHYSIKFTS